MLSGLFSAADFKVGAVKQSAMHQRISDVWGLLRLVDPQLHGHLIACSVLPQLFLLRWCRVLLAREFGLDDTLLIFDELLGNLSCLDFVCIAVLLSVRVQLLSCDGLQPLNLLLRLPRPRDIRTVIALSRFVRSAVEATDSKVSLFVLMRFML